jgi:predicted nucleic acid-binding protein
LKLVIDSDVLVHALRFPKDETLLSLHEKASQIFESCISGANELVIPSVIPVEVGTVLSKILPSELANEGIEKLLQVAVEIYPFTIDTSLNSLYSLSSSQYFQRCITNSSKLSKIKKNPKDKDVAGWNKSKTEVMLGGMDVFVLSYAEMKSAKLITNDWSLWYAAWKTDISSYWFSGLTIEQISDIANGLSVK